VFNCIFFSCECVFFKTFIYICNEIIPACSKMKLTNTSEYALRILTFMARNPEGLFSAKSLVEKLNISDKYLRRLMTDLAKVRILNAYSDVFVSFILLQGGIISLQMYMKVLKKTHSQPKKIQLNT
jgi:hypothetical protein